MQHPPPPQHLNPRNYNRPPDFAGAKAADASFGSRPFPPAQLAEITANLRKRLGPEYISNRSGPGGTKLSYVEGWKVVNIANEIFGFSGWSSTVQSLSIDQEEMTADGKFNISMSAIVRITLQDGAFREDVGYGQIANSPSRASAYEKVKKEAVTDSMKRALKAFGPALGNCCYDKDYLTKVSRCSIPKLPFLMSELYRAPEFREQPAVEMKTMETEFGNVAASVLAVTSSTIQYRQQQQPQLHQPLAAAATAAHSVLGPSNIHNNGNKQNHANIDQSVLSIESDSNKFFPADPEGMDSDLFFEITSQEQKEILMDVDLTSEALKSIVPTFSVVPVVNPASSTSAINNTVNKTTTIAAAAPEVTLVVKNHHQTTPVNHRPDGIMNGVGIMNHHRHQQQKPVMAVNAAIVPKQQNNSNTKNTSSPRPTMGAAASSINNNTNNNNYFPKNGSVGMGAKHRQQSSPNHHPPVLNKNQSNPPFNAPQHPQSILKRSVSMVNIGITNVNGGAGHHQKSPPNPGGINTSLSSVLKQPTSTPIGNNNTKSSISTTMPVVNQHQQQQTLNRPFQSLQQKQSPHGMQGMGNQNQPPQPPQIVNCVNNISKPEMMVHLQKTAVGAGMCIGNHLNSNNTGDGLNKRPRCD